jgi:hypothetical protein
MDLKKFYKKNKPLVISIWVLLFIGIITMIVLLSIPKKSNDEEKDDKDPGNPDPMPYNPRDEPDEPLPYEPHPYVPPNEPDPIYDPDVPVPIYDPEDEDIDEPDIPYEPIRPTGDFANVMLDYHNELRQRCSPLNKTMSWDVGLADYAQRYAEELANNTNCQLKHSDSYGLLSAGENLAMSYGYSTDQAIKNAINGWANEGYGKDATGPVTGHYTAMMWKDTTKLGCGLAQNGDCTIISCNYSDTYPNVGGQYESQVLCTKPFYV